MRTKMTSNNTILLSIQDWVIPVAAAGGGLFLLAVIGAAIWCCRGDSSRHRNPRYYDREHSRRKHAVNVGANYLIILISILKYHIAWHSQHSLSVNCYLTILYRCIKRNYRLYSQPSLILKLEGYSRKYGSSMSRVGLTGV